MADRLKVRYPGPGVTDPAVRAMASIHVATGLRMDPGVPFEVSAAERSLLGDQVEEVPRLVEAGADVKADGDWLVRASRLAGQRREHDKRERTK
jgi:hypothetical protein